MQEVWKISSPSWCEHTEKQEFVLTFYLEISRHNFVQISELYLGAKAQQDSEPIYRDLLGI